MTHPQEEIETVKVGKPGKRWRNRWLAKRDGVRMKFDQPKSAGEEAFGRLIHPSAEIAEAYAMTKSPENSPPGFWDRWEYLGPIQVEDAGE